MYLWACLVIFTICLVGIKFIWVSCSFKNSWVYIRIKVWMCMYMLLFICTNFVYLKNKMLKYKTCWLCSVFVFSCKFYLFSHIFSVFGTQFACKSIKNSVIKTKLYLKYFCCYYCCFNTYLYKTSRCIC